jgi:hypothetical protein
LRLFGLVGEFFDRFVTLVGTHLNSPFDRTRLGRRVHTRDYALADSRNHTTPTTNQEQPNSLSCSQFGKDLAGNALGPPDPGPGRIKLLRHIDDLRRLRIRVVDLIGHVLGDNRRISSSRPARRRSTSQRMAAESPADDVAGGAWCGDTAKTWAGQGIFIHTLIKIATLTA